jgi:2-oxoglutarate ferredoxin oxidoreductase subunit delta
MAKVKIDKDKCKGCQLCIMYCPASHLEFSSELNKRGLKYAQIKRATKCTGCGFCFLVCPECCIEVYTETSNQKPEHRGIKIEDRKN